MLHVVVRGQVQGVGFRWFVRERARELGIGGWVRNCADGSVEVAADAPDGTLAALRDALRTGPAGARVSHVDDVPTAADPPLSDVFLILR